MILVLIGMLILLYSFLDYKKAFMLFIVYQIFWYYNAPLFSIGGKTLTASMGFTFFFFVLYFLKHKKYVYPKEKNPYSVPMILMTVSTFATCFSSLAGFTSELTRCLSTRIFPYIIVLWLMWQLLETKRDFWVLYKMITITIFIGCIFGLYEYMIHSNFLFDIKNSIAGGSLYNYNTSGNTDASLRGYRLMSLFEHPLTAGMAFGIYSSFTLSIFVKNKTDIPMRKLAIITALLCLPCIVLTKMRSVFVFAAISLFSIIDFRNKKFYKVIFLLVAGMIGAWPLISQHINLILSIFDSGLQSSVGGSSLTMRLSQFDAVLRIMQLAPMTGLGESFKYYIDSSLLAGTLSFESVLFEQMAQHGILGVVAYSVLAYYSLIKIPKKYHSREAFFTSLAYWITIIITGESNFRIFLYYLPLIYFIKSSNEYKMLTSRVKPPLSISFGRHCISNNIKN